MLRQHRGFAALSIASLALAVGANAAVFAIVNALWLRPLPFPDPDRLVMLMRDRTAAGSEESMSAVGLESREAWLAFAGVAGQVVTTGDFASLTPRLVLDRVGMPMETLAVTSQYFRLLGLEIRGRDFTRDDNRYSSEPVAIISDRLWQRAFGRSPDAIGAVAAAKPFPVRIIGVAPPGFAGARRGERADLWVPGNLVPRLASGRGESPLIAEDSLPCIVLARLHPGQSPAEARQYLLQGADERRRRSLEDVVIVPLAQVFGTPDSPTVIVREHGAARVAASLAGLVLLAGCMTLMTLVLVHYERRRREFAIRRSLGASPRRLVASISRELGWVVALGAAAAILVSTWSVRVLPSLRLPGGVDISRLDLSLDWRVTAIALSAAALTILVAALVPVRRLTRASLIRDLVSAGATATTVRSSQRLRQTLLAVHVAAAVVVLVGAGLFVRAVWYGFHAGAGFDADRVLFVEVQLVPIANPSAVARATRAAVIAEGTAGLLEGLRAMPGVTVVAFGESPIGASQARRAWTPVTIETTGDRRQVRVGELAGSPELLPALGVPVLEGRALTAADAGIRPQPAVVTASLARTLWPGRDPLGETVAPRFVRYEVVGVVRDFAYGSLTDPPAGVLVSVRPDRPEGLARLVVRSDTPDRLVGPMRALVHRRAPDAPRVEMSIGREVIARDLGQVRLGAWFFSGFGVVALVLGAGGVFGLVAYLFESRRREFGIRLALGATPRALVRHGLAVALIPVSIGVVAGVLTAIPVTRSLASFLIGVTPLDPATYAGVAVAIMAPAAAAALAAAWRLGRVAPSEARDARD